MTLWEPVRFSRSPYECAVCGQVRYPGDELLDVVGTGRSPGLRRMMARADSRQTFKAAREDLKVYAGLELSVKDVEQVAEATGEQIEGWECCSPGMLSGCRNTGGGGGAIWMKVGLRKSCVKRASDYPSRGSFAKAPSSSLTTLKTTSSGCVMPSFENRGCLWALGSWRRVANI